MGDNLFPNSNGGFNNKSSPAISSSDSATTPANTHSSPATVSFNSSSNFVGTPLLPGLYRERPMPDRAHLKAIVDRLVNAQPNSTEVFATSPSSGARTDVPRSPVVAGIGGERLVGSSSSSFFAGSRPEVSSLHLATSSSSRAGIDVSRSPLVTGIGGDRFVGSNSSTFFGCSESLGSLAEVHASVPEVIAAGVFPNTEIVGGGFPGDTQGIVGNRGILNASVPELMAAGVLPKNTESSGGGLPRNTQGNVGSRGSENVGSRGEVFNLAAAINGGGAYPRFTPVIVNLNPNQEIRTRLLSLVEKQDQAFSIVSATGVLKSAILSSRTGLTVHEGLLDILSMQGVFYRTETDTVMKISLTGINSGVIYGGELEQGIVEERTTLVLAAFPRHLMEH